MSQRKYYRPEGVTERTCRCGNVFFVFLPEEDWKRECIECWKLKKERSKSWHERHFGKKEEAPRQNTAGSSTGLEAEFQENLRVLLQLCHPDKHGGSAAATRITQWLLKHKRR